LFDFLCLVAYSGQRFVPVLAAFTQNSERFAGEPRHMRSDQAARLIRLVVSLSVLGGLVAVAAPARADEAEMIGRVTKMNKKAIEEYENLNFEEARKILREALDVCTANGLDKHPIKARTHIHLGIVIFAGFKQKELALKQFRKALDIQPDIRLTKSLANPEIQAAFDEALAGAGSDKGEVIAEKDKDKDKDKDKERDKEREKRALLSDAELNTIRRNASELLDLHEDLFTMLTDAIRVSGWVTGLNALEATQEFGSDPLITDSEDAEGCFENALISVATLFTAQVSQSFFMILQILSCFPCFHLGAFLNGWLVLTFFVQGRNLQRLRVILCGTSWRD
jgi:tetratricopeptide (TPR) repeat protein